jgi:hypothetical protein
LEAGPRLTSPHDSCEGHQELPSNHGAPCAVRTGTVGGGRRQCSGVTKRHNGRRSTGNGSRRYAIVRGARAHNSTAPRVDPHPMSPFHTPRNIGSDRGSVSVFATRRDVAARESPFVGTLREPVFGFRSMSGSEPLFRRHGAREVLTLFVPSASRDVSRRAVERDPGRTRRALRTEPAGRPH